MEKNRLKAVIEAILFMSPEPLGPGDLKRMLKAKNEEAAPTAESAPVAESVEAAVEAGAAEAPASEAPIEESAETALEAVIEAAAEEGITEIDPLTQLQQMQAKMEEEISKSEIQEILNELANEYAENEARGFELVEIAKGYQFRTKLNLSPYLKNLYKLPKPRLSQPGMETLSIVAYQQPVSRNRIEEIRGVDTGGVLKTLLERDLVRIVGRSDEAGRPILYGTTKAFLETFSLASLSDLPTLKDLANLEPSGTGSISGAEDDGSDPEFAEFESDSVESVEFVAMDDASAELIDDLESSMSQLKNIEQQIFDQKKPDAEQPE